VNVAVCFHAAPDASKLFHTLFAVSPIPIKMPVVKAMDSSAGFPHHAQAHGWVLIGAEKVRHAP
jgi:hypothetical protein